MHEYHDASSHTYILYSLNSFYLILLIVLSLYLFSIEFKRIHVYNDIHDLSLQLKTSWGSCRFLPTVHKQVRRVVRFPEYEMSLISADDQYSLDNSSQTVADDRGFLYDELRVWTRTIIRGAFWSLCLSPSLDFRWNTAEIKLSLEWSANHGQSGIALPAIVPIFTTSVN